MLAKIYWYIWLAIALVFALFSVTGNMTDMAWVSFGFIAFGMTFMGMMGVLPAMNAEHEPKREPAIKTAKARSAITVPIQHGARSVGV